jgi:hypothetical protein
MTSFIVAAGAGEDAGFDHVRLHLAAAAYLARFKGLSREHTDSDLRAFLSWCAGRDIDPLRAQRAQLELYVRWMQETRRFKPLDGFPAYLGAQRVLPQRRHRRRLEGCGVWPPQRGSGSHVCTRTCSGTRS